MAERVVEANEIFISRYAPDLTFTIRSNTHISTVETSQTSLRAHVKYSEEL